MHMNSPVGWTLGLILACVLIGNLMWMTNIAEKIDRLQYTVGSYLEEKEGPQPQREPRDWEAYFKDLEDRGIEW